MVTQFISMKTQDRKLPINSYVEKHCCK